MLVGQQWWGEPLVGDLALFVSFSCKGKARGDLDNYIAGLLDGLQDSRTCFANDKQFKRIEADLLESRGLDMIKLTIASLSHIG